MNPREFFGIDEVTVARGNLIWRALLAEFLANLLVNFIGCGSYVNFSGTPSTQTMIGLTFGLTYFVLFYILSHVSGCHISSAVTIGQMVAYKVHIIKGILYIIVQCLGAMAGSIVLRIVMPKEFDEYMGNTEVSDHVSALVGLIYEVLMTFFFVLTYFGVTDRYRYETKATGALAIGLSVAVCHLVGIDVTGASMNPARSLGSTFVLDKWEEHWVFWAGPIIGGILAALLYTWVFADPAKNPDKYGLDYSDSQSIITQR